MTENNLDQLGQEEQRVYSLLPEVERLVAEGVDPEEIRPLLDELQQLSTDGYLNRLQIARLNTLQQTLNNYDRRSQPRRDLVELANEGRLLHLQQLLNRQEAARGKILNEAKIDPATIQGIFTQLERATLTPEETARFNRLRQHAEQVFPELLSKQQEEKLPKLPTEATFDEAKVQRQLSEFAAHLDQANDAQLPIEQRIDLFLQAGEIAVNLDQENLSSGPSIQNEFTQQVQRLEEARANLAQNLFEQINERINDIATRSSEEEVNADAAALDRLISRLENPDIAKALQLARPNDLDEKIEKALDAVRANAEKTFTANLERIRNAVTSLSGVVLQNGFNPDAAIDFNGRNYQNVFGVIENLEDELDNLQKPFGYKSNWQDQLTPNQQGIFNNSANNLSSLKDYCSDVQLARDLTTMWTSELDAHAEEISKILNFAISSQNTEYIQPYQQLLDKITQEQKLRGIEVKAQHQVALVNNLIGTARQPNFDLVTTYPITENKVTTNITFEGLIVIAETNAKLLETEYANLPITSKQTLRTEVNNGQAVLAELRAFVETVETIDALAQDVANNTIDRPNFDARRTQLEQQIASLTDQELRTRLTERLNATQAPKEKLSPKNAFAENFSKINGGLQTLDLRQEVWPYLNEMTGETIPVDAVTYLRDTLADLGDRLTDGERRQVNALIQRVQERITILDTQALTDWQQYVHVLPWWTAAETAITMVLPSVTDRSGLEASLQSTQQALQNFNAGITALNGTQYQIGNQQLIQVHAEETRTLIQTVINELNKRLGENTAAEQEAQRIAAEKQTRQNELNTWRQEIERLRDIIEYIATQLDENKVKPHSADPNAVGTPQLELYQSQLNTIYTAAETAALLNNSTNQDIENERVILVGKDKLEGAYKKAKSKVDKMLARSKEAKEKTKQERARARIEQLWANIAATESVTKNHPTNTNSLDAAYVASRDNIETAGLLPLVREFFPEETRKWQLKIDLHNGFSASAKHDVFKQFYFKNAITARESAASHIDQNKMREFAMHKDISEGFEAMHDYFKSPQEYAWYQEGNDKIEAKKVINVVNGVTTEVYVNRSGTIIDETRITKAKHDYAKDGNPNSEQTDLGVLTIAQLLKLQLPGLVDSDIDSLQYLGILGEVRLKYYAAYYASYLKTADGTFDTKVIAYHAPMAAILYKIRGYGKIPPDMKLLWQILRLPPYEKVATPGSLYIEPIETKIKDYRNRIMVVNGKQMRAKDYIESQPKGSAGKEYGTGYNNDQVHEAIEVRNMIDEGLSRFSEDFEAVPCDENLAIIPFMWDLLFELKNPQDSTKHDYTKTADRKFGPITYAEYYESFNAWKEFLKEAQYPEPIHKASDVNDRIGGLVLKISPFKAFLVVMPESTPEGVRFRKVLQQIIFRYTKHIYDQYNKKAEMKWYQLIGRAWSKRCWFFKVVLSEYEKLGTMDKSLQKFIIHKLEHYNKIGIFDDLFSDSSGHPLHILTVGGNISELRRREELIEQYTKDETAEEKKA